MELIDPIRNRWSPRAFDNKAIKKEELYQLFEAARWSASSMNEQPWSYYYAFRGETGHKKMLACLAPGNSVWAGAAPLLILSVAKIRFTYNNKANRHALHDVGAANLALSIQASSMGIQVHQSGGFDMDLTIETFDLDPGQYVPATFMALGYPGNPAILSDDMRRLETSPRKRKPSEDLSKHFV